MQLFFISNYKLSIEFLSFWLVMDHQETHSHNILPSQLLPPNLLLILLFFFISSLFLVISSKFLQIFQWFQIIIQFVAMILKGILFPIQQITLNN